MKKVIFSFLTVAISLSSAAQITITQNDMLSAPTVYIYHNTSDLNSEDFTLTGANYSWDYSAATENGNDTLSAVTVGSTPFAYQYYFNNQFQLPDHKSDYAVAGQDINAAGQVTIEERFDYFKVNSNSLEVTGFGAKVNGTPASVKYDTIDQKYPFTMSYAMPLHNSTGYYLLTIPGFGTYGQWIRREVESDGWGELITPMETYPNTLRVKTTLEQRDTFYVDQFGFGQTVDRPTEIIYEWFTNSETAPVMSVSESGGQITNVKYMATVASGVESNELVFEIIPSSTEGIFNIINKSATQIKSLNVYDLNGKLIISKSSQFDEINISQFSNGLYLLNIETEEGQNYLHKVVR